VSSIKTNMPAHHRARAIEARRKAAAATDESVRKILLNDAELWERMAEWEEKNPPLPSDRLSGR
jgi:hypothetical protein